MKKYFLLKNFSKHVEKHFLLKNSPNRKKVKNLMVTAIQVIAINNPGQFRAYEHYKK